MQGSSNILVRVARSARPYAIAFVGFGVLFSAQACGTNKAKTDPNVGVTPTPNDGDVNGKTPTTITDNSAACTLTNRSTLGGGSSPNLIYTNAAGAKTALPYVLFTSAGSGGNMVYEFAAFDYDYCAFSADFNYSVWPLSPWHAVGAYVINNAKATPLVNGTYNLATGGASGQVVDGNRSGITVSSAQSTPNAKCATLAFPTLDPAATGQTTTPTGTLTITDISASTNASNKTNVAGVTGSMNLTFGDGSTLVGPFTTGACSAYDPTTRPASLGTPEQCGCKLQ